MFTVKVPQHRVDVRVHRDSRRCSCRRPRSQCVIVFRSSEPTAGYRQLVAVSGSWQSVALVLGMGGFKVAG